MFHGLFCACGAYAHAFFGGFFIPWEFLHCPMSRAVARCLVSVFFCKTPSAALFWMILVSLATARKAILPFDVFLA